MAIFGNLEDIPLPDILSMVGRSTGKFVVFNTDVGRRFELHFADGTLCGCLIDSTPAEDVLHVRNIFVELVRCRTGDFEFDRQPASALRVEFRLPVDQLLLSSLATMDELESLRENLPPPETIFRAVAAEDKLWFDAELQNFWESARHLLEIGVSSVELSSRLSLSTDQVRLFLYKLRTGGFVTPYRAFEHDALRPALAALHRRPLPDLERAPSLGSVQPLPADPSTRHDLRHVRPASVARSFLNGLLTRIGVMVNS